MIVEHSKEIINYLSKLNLNFSKPQTAHLLDFASAVISSESKKTVAGISRSISRDIHPCNRTRFLNKSPFDDNELKLSRINNSMNSLIVEANSLKKPMPIFISIDDTLILKSKDRKQIEGLSFQFSHVTGKAEFSHCQVAMSANTGNLSIPLDFKMYLSKDYCQKKNLEFKSKPDLALDLIQSLNFTKDNQTYLLMDKWYGSKNLIMESLRLGIHTIVPIKSSRVIFPDGIQQNIKSFSENLGRSDLNLVTVSGKDYYTYRYEGHLKGIPNTIVLISYEVNGDILKAPMYLLSTDISLTNSKIIDFYLNRWSIEVGFRYQKESLGLDHYQMRSLKGIKRFWEIIYLAHSYLAIKLWTSKNFTTLGDVIRDEKYLNSKKMIIFICNLKDQKKSNEEILKKVLKRTA